MEAVRSDVLDWLLQGDPVIRWQVMQDLLDALAGRVQRERDRLATEGWVAALLDRQDADGRWAGALYSPKWTSTTYTLLLLARLGLPPGHPSALAGCRELWRGARVFEGGLDLSGRSRRPELCITSMVIYLSARFEYVDPRLDGVVTGLLSHQLDDGGWNCAALDDPAKHASFNTTILALEALAELADGATVNAAAHRARAFFLDHRLYRSHRSGEVAIPSSTRFPFPPQWHFDVLRGLEHFAATHAARDDRLGDAVDLVRRRRRKDGRWSTYAPYPGRTWFELEQSGPSRWNTLRALRVLRWWDGASQSLG